MCPESALLRPLGPLRGEHACIFYCIYKAVPVLQPQEVFGKTPVGSEQTERHFLFEILQFSRYK